MISIGINLRRKWETLHNKTSRTWKEKSKKKNWTPGRYSTSRINMKSAPLSKVVYRFSVAAIKAKMLLFTELKKKLENSYGSIKDHK